MGDEPTSLRGQLLIASPALVDPNFLRTVVLVAEHGEEGAMGLVLNRPSQAGVAEAVPELAELVEADARVYVGGPVEPSAVLVLAEFEDCDQAATIVLGNVGFLGSDADGPRLSGTTRRARVFAGYAGWAAGQLEAELAQSAWILEPVRPDEIFTDAPDDLWSAVLRRKGGQFALLATMPLDPSLN